ncbi:MAG: SDR family oxidoreductase [Crocinitomicaceae bacterium]|nr:SDR family oxidoreductase [Crocinitomicaceae bacterium]
MRERGYGRIVLISSILAESPVVSTGIYAGCKGFLDSIAKTVALENAGKGVTCNTIQLGYFDGGLTYRIPEKILDHIVGSIPMKRIGTIDELNDLIQTLISVEYITGTSIKMNGGLDF